MWDVIYQANLEQIDDPNWIRIGQIGKTHPHKAAV